MAYARRYNSTTLPGGPPMRNIANDSFDRQPWTVTSMNRSHPHDSTPIPARQTPSNGCTISPQRTPQRKWVPLESSFDESASHSLPLSSSYPLQSAPQNVSFGTPRSEVRSYSDQFQKSPYKTPADCSISPTPRLRLSDWKVHHQHPVSKVALYPADEHAPQPSKPLPYGRRTSSPNPSSRIPGPPKIPPEPPAPPSEPPAPPPEPPAPPPEPLKPPPELLEPPPEPPAPPPEPPALPSGPVIPLLEPPAPAPEPPVLPLESPTAPPGPPALLHELPALPLPTTEIYLRDEVQELADQMAIQLPPVTGLMDESESSVPFILDAAEEVTSNGDSLSPTCSSAQSPRLLPTPVPEVLLSPRAQASSSSWPIMVAIGIAILIVLMSTLTYPSEAGGDAAEAQITATPSEDIVEHGDTVGLAKLWQKCFGQDSNTASPWDCAFRYMYGQRSDAPMSEAQAVVKEDPYQDMYPEAETPADRERQPNTMEPQAEVQPQSEQQEELKRQREEAELLRQHQQQQKQQQEEELEQQRQLAEIKRQQEEAELQMQRQQEEEEEAEMQRQLQELKRQQEELQRREEEEEAEAELQRQQEEAEKKRQQEEEQKRQQEAEKKRQQEEAEAEQKRQQEEAEQKRQQEEAEQKRQQEEAEQKRQQEEAEQKRQQEEAEQKRQQEEAEKKRQQEEAEQKRQQEEAEKKRQQEEAEQKRQQEEAKQKRQQEEAEKKRQQEEAEQKRQQEEAEKKRQQEEAEAERKRRQEEAQLKRQPEKEETEPRRQQEEEEKKKEEAELQSQCNAVLELDVGQKSPEKYATEPSASVSKMNDETPLQTVDQAVDDTMEQHDELSDDEQQMVRSEKEVEMPLAEAGQFAVPRQAAPSVLESGIPKEPAVDETAHPFQQADVEANPLAKLVEDDSQTPHLDKVEGQVLQKTLSQPIPDSASSVAASRPHDVSSAEESTEKSASVPAEAKRDPANIYENLLKQILQEEGARQKREQELLEWKERVADLEKKLAMIQQATMAATAHQSSDAKIVAQSSAEPNHQQPSIDLTPQIPQTTPNAMGVSSADNSQSTSVVDEEFPSQSADNTISKPTADNAIGTPEETTVSSNESVTPAEALKEDEEDDFFEELGEQTATGVSFVLTALSIVLRYLSLCLWLGAGVLFLWIWRKAKLFPKEAARRSSIAEPYVFPAPSVGRPSGRPKELGGVALPKSLLQGETLDLRGRRNLRGPGST